jgi:NAD(P)-dependent dehydrogenase (short-subunit alcohol dehydrogenase family)
MHEKASQSPAHLILASRSPPKIQECVDDLKAKFPDVDYRPLQVDLSSQQSVRKAAAEVLSWSDVPTVNIVVNSAGVMFVPKRTLSEDGIEMHFATNHIGHFLLTSLIMPKLIKAAESSPKGATRIVNVTSGSPMWCSMRWSDINFDKKNRDLPEADQPSYELLRMWAVPEPENQSYIPFEGYNQSKVANLLFAIGANKRLYEKYGILSFAVHPGVIKTELARSATEEVFAAVKKMMEQGVFTYISQAAGASTSLVAALDPKLGPGEPRDGKENYGTFLSNCQINPKAAALAESNSEAEKLWKLSEKLVKEDFSW